VLHDLLVGVLILLNLLIVGVLEVGVAWQVVVEVVLVERCGFRRERLLVFLGLLGLLGELGVVEHLHLVVVGLQPHGVLQVGSDVHWCLVVEQQVLVLIAVLSVVEHAIRVLHDLLVGVLILLNLLIVGVLEVGVAWQVVVEVVLVERCGFRRERLLVFLGLLGLLGELGVVEHLHLVVVGLQPHGVLQVRSDIHGGLIVEELVAWGRDARWVWVHRRVASHRHAWQITPHVALLKRRLLFEIVLGFSAGVPDGVIVVFFLLVSNMVLAVHAMGHGMGMGMDRLVVVERAEVVLQSRIDVVLQSRVDVVRHELMQGSIVVGSCGVVGR